MDTFGSFSQHYHKNLNSGYLHVIFSHKNQTGLLLQTGAEPLTSWYASDFRSRIILIKGSPTLPQLCRVGVCDCIYVRIYILVDRLVHWLCFILGEVIPRNELAQEKLSVLFPALQIIF